MPRTNMGKTQETFRAMRKALMGCGSAPELAAALGCSVPTARRKMEDPGQVTLADLKKLNKEEFMFLEEIQAAVTWPYAVKKPKEEKPNEKKR